MTTFEPAYGPDYSEEYVFYDGVWDVANSVHRTADGFVDPDCASINAGF